MVLLSWKQPVGKLVLCARKHIVTRAQIKYSAYDISWHINHIFQAKSGQKEGLN